MDIPNNYYRVSIKALILNDEGKFLLFQEKSGIWELPGGGLDHGEEVEECLKRELHEEAGLEVTSIDTTPTAVSMGETSTGKPKLNIIYKVVVKDLNFTSTDECMAIQFFNKEEALSATIPGSVRMFVEQM